MTAPFYLTRDSTAGVPDDNIDVWASKPRRQRLRFGGVVWLGPAMERPVARLELATARARFATLPDTDIELICYGTPVAPRDLTGEQRLDAIAAELVGFGAPPVPAVKKRR